VDACDGAAMSFDIHLQAFKDGEAVDRDGAEVRQRLLRVAKRYEPESGFVEVGDDLGPADIYGVPPEGAALKSLMFNHVGDNGFDLLVEVAQIARLVVMPLGCPVCIVHEEQRQDLPPELAEADVEVVTTGKALLDVIRRS
jgi:hypothetical protein